MGNTNNILTFCNLTMIPSDSWYDKDINAKYNELNIIVKEPITQDASFNPTPNSGWSWILGNHNFNEASTECIFPEGWTTEIEGDYFTKYYDPNKVCKIITYFENTGTKKYSQTIFVDEIDQDFENIPLEILEIMTNLNIN